MIIKDGLYKFSLYPGCDALYIDKEGLTSTRLDDGTIVEVPNYVYHPLSIYTIGMNEDYEYEHPKRNFKFKAQNIKFVPKKIVNALLVQNPDRTKECVDALKKKARKLFEQPTRSGVCVTFSLNKILFKVYRKYWYSGKTFSYYCDYDDRWKSSTMNSKKDIWGSQSTDEVVRKYAELHDIIEYVLGRRDIPYVSYELVKLISTC